LDGGGRLSGNFETEKSGRRIGGRQIGVHTGGGRHIIINFHGAALAGNIASVILAVAASHHDFGESPTTVNLIKEAHSRDRITFSINHNRIHRKGSGVVGGVWYGCHRNAAPSYLMGNRGNCAGVREGDSLPSVLLEPSAPPLPPLTLTLEPASLGLSARTGRSWRERTLSLLARFGPGALAWLEALIIASDRRASRLTTADPELASSPEEP